MSQPDMPSRQTAWLQRAQERGPMSRLLWPVSLLYRALMALRRGLYATGLLKVHDLGVPVVVIGNVVVGGAGKTPCTIAVVNHLLAKGWHPGVVSRGHGRGATGVTPVRSDTPAREAGDEPLLIHQRTGVPVWVAASRVAAARALRNANPEVDVLVCDDGLQHLALGRQLSIVVFDDRGAGNGWLLPAGLLREPWPPALHSPFRPDLLLRQGREGVPEASNVDAPGMPSFHATRRLASHALGPQGQRIELSRLCGLPLTAVAGIARPQVFFDMLRESGLAPTRHVALPDHAPPAAYAALVSEATQAVVCTEKDATKLFALLPQDGSVQAWAVPLELSPDPAFFSAVDAHLARWKTQR
jgi:tetraacyldisaccharide 4'-kinase